MTAEEATREYLKILEKARVGLNYWHRLQTPAAKQPALEQQAPAPMLQPRIEKPAATAVPPATRPQSQVWQHPTVVAVQDNGVSTDAQLRAQHVHTAKADSTCPQCRQLWVQS
jgi:uncharacterized membrane protein